MALEVKDRVQQTATANTTVSFTLTGTVTGFQTFATALTNGATTYYAATDTSGNWEVGEGTFSTTGPTLTRTSIIDSNTGGAAITFVGTVTVFITYPAYYALFITPSAEISQPVILPPSSVWNGDPIDVAYGGTNSTAPATAGGIGYGTGTAHAYTTAGTSGQVLTSAGAGVPTWTTPTTGTVTGVTATSPVASSGGAAPVISLSAGYGDTLNPYASKTANFFLAAPNGAAGVPTFRAIVAADIPTLNQNTTGSAGSVANALTIGTGLSGTSFNGSAAVTVAIDSTVATLSGTQTLTNKTLTSPTMIGTLIEDVFTITDAAGFAIDPDNGSIQLVTLGANRTPTVANFNVGEAVTLMINNGTAYTITWTTIGVVWVGGTAPTLATTGYTVVELWRVNSTYYGALVGNVA